MAWLLRDEEVLATAEIAATRKLRRKGLLGRDSIDGALVIRPCRHVHTIRMCFKIDVAFCDKDGFVLAIKSLAPNRLSRIVPRAGFVVEAATGAFERWHLRVGDQLEVRE